MTKLYIVIPCYNEQEVLPITAGILIKKVKNMMQNGSISEDSRIVLVDDGSKDETWTTIEKLHNENKIFIGCKLSCNKGHQNALLAGLNYSLGKADAVISMDADLQDDINAIDEFVRCYEDGYDIVYGVRSSRKKDTFFKKTTALMYYKLLEKLGCDIVNNHADYRLMSARALEALFEFKEVNMFLRGIVPMVGYRSCNVYYERNERAAGKSKYPLKKMLMFAVDGITSLSIKPIRLITTLGVIGTILCFAVLICLLINGMCSAESLLGVLVGTVGSVQLISVGVIGEYIGKIYMESKHRPRFIIDKVIE